MSAPTTQPAGSPKYVAAWRIGHALVCVSVEQEPKALCGTDRPQVLTVQELAHLCRTSPAHHALRFGQRPRATRNSCPLTHRPVLFPRWQNEEVHTILARRPIHVLALHFQQMPHATGVAAGECLQHVHTGNQRTSTLTAVTERLPASSWRRAHCSRARDLTTYVQVRPLLNFVGHQRQDETIHGVHH